MHRQGLKQQLTKARQQTDFLFDHIRDGFLYHRPIDRRHRLIFYLGHLEAFDWNHVARFGLSEPCCEPAFDSLFAAGIDPDSSNLPSDTPEDWPTISQVESYVGRVRSRIDQLIDAAPEPLVQMAVEHRLMHAETLAYGLHAMPYETKVGRRVPPLEAPPRGDNPMCAIPGGNATLGRADDGFGWDNEFEGHTVFVDGFAINRFKVTNRDYLEFVNQGAAPPPFWQQEKGEWFYRGMFDLAPLPLEDPVYVTWEQAQAYSQWKNLALPTEAEFHRAAFGTVDEGREREYPWGDDEPSAAHGNFDFERWDPVPVTAHEAGDSAFGVRQLTGNGWEWTSTAFAPFDGFTPAPNYPGYSANFFDGEHYVLKGGSPRTASLLLRRSFRNWFRPDYPYVYATFRCVAR